MIFKLSVLGASAALLAIACSGDSGSVGAKPPGSGAGGDASVAGGAAGAAGAPDASFGSGGGPTADSGSGGSAGAEGGGNQHSGGTSGTDSGRTADGGGATPGTAGDDGGNLPVDAGPGAGPLGDAATTDSASNPGPYTVATYTSGYKDGANFAAGTVHYPADAPPPFPIVAIVPGYRAEQSSIQAWGPFLASHGIIAMTIDTNSPVDQPDVRELALMDALNSLAAENTREGGPLKGKIDVRKKATMGWSMGGGGALIAANNHRDLKASISLCGWDPSATFPNDQVPTLLLAASADPLAGGMSQGFYASIPDTTPKELYEVNGGTHFTANDPANEDKQIGLYGLSWLEVFLVGDERYRPFLKTTPMNSATFENNL